MYSYLKWILTWFLSFCLIQENAELLGADLDSEAWQSYTEHVDRNILTGFCSAVRCSLQYLVENTDPALHIDPLFEVQLTLTSDMTFHPSLNLSKKGNFYDIIDQMVSDIFKMASFIKRVAKSKQSETYKVCNNIYLYACLAHMFMFTVYEL